MESDHVHFDARWDHELVQVGTALRRRPRSATDGRWFGRTSASRTRTAAERRPYLDWVHGKNPGQFEAHWDRERAGGLRGVRSVATWCGRQRVIEKVAPFVFPPPAKTCGVREPTQRFMLMGCDFRYGIIAFPFGRKCFRWKSRGWRSRTRSGRFRKSFQRR